MSEPKFTKGPWKADLTNTKEYIAVEPYIYIKREYQYDSSVEEEKANASLIASAPDMYALLLDIVTDYQCMPNPVVMADKIEAVLKKARGEE